MIGEQNEPPYNGLPLFASPEVQELLKFNGLDTLTAALDYGEPLSGNLAQRGGRHGHKSVTRATLL